MQQSGTVGDYLEQFVIRAAEQAASIYRSLDAKMVFPDIIYKMNEGEEHDRT
jgi:hypothetical protein